MKIKSITVYQNFVLVKMMIYSLVTSQWWLVIWRCYHELLDDSPIWGVANHCYSAYNHADHYRFYQIFNRHRSFAHSSLRQLVNNTVASFHESSEDPLKHAKSSSQTLVWSMTTFINKRCF